MVKFVTKNVKNDTNEVWIDFLENSSESNKKNSLERPCKNLSNCMKKKKNLLAPSGH